MVCFQPGQVDELGPLEDEGARKRPWARGTASLGCRVPPALPPTRLPLLFPFYLLPFCKPVFKLLSNPNYTSYSNPSVERQAHPWGPALSLLLSDCQAAGGLSP